MYTLHARIVFLKRGIIGQTRNNSKGKAAGIIFLLT